VHHVLTHTESSCTGASLWRVNTRTSVSLSTRPSRRASTALAMRSGRLVESEYSALPPAPLAPPSRRDNSSLSCLTNSEKYHTRSCEQRASRVPSLESRTVIHGVRSLLAKALHGVH